MGVFLLLLSAGGLDYLFVGPVPLWILVVVSCGLFLEKIRSPFRPARLLRTRRVLSWQVFAALLLAWAAGVDALDGDWSIAVDRVLTVGAAALLLMLVAAGTSAAAGKRRTIAAILAVLSLQAVVGLLQYLGNELAWDLPDLLVRISGSRAQGYAGILEAGSFADIGRVRGTHLLVHKFSGFIAALSSFSLSIAILPPRHPRFGRKGRLVLLSLAVVALLVTLLTFSRSSLIGIALTTAILLAASIRRGRGSVARVLALGGALLAAATWLSIGSSSQASRLGDFGGAENTNNLLRAESYRLAWGSFLDSPIAGEGFQLSWADQFPIGLHSVPLHILASYGIVGLFLYLCAIAATVRSTQRHRNGPASPELRLAFIACLLTLLVDSATHTSGLYFADVAQAAIVGILVGLFLSNDAGNGSGIDVSIQ